MELACLDLEGVLVPEIWIEFAQRTGIDELRATTRDIPDYDVLMRQRLALLDQHKLKIDDIQEALLAEEFDPTVELEAAAAGGDNAAGGGHPTPDFVRVAPDAEITSGAETIGIVPSGVDTLEGVATNIPPDPDPDILSKETIRRELVSLGVSLEKNGKPRNPFKRFKPVQYSNSIKHK